MDYTLLLKKSTNFHSLTGLSPEEFELLLPIFSDRWHKYIQHHTLEGKKRVRRPQKTRKNLEFPRSGDKLFFVLYQLKNNCLQENLAAIFQMHQPHVSFWFKLLSKILEEALSKEGVLPETQSDRINRALKGEIFTVIDGVERPIQRSTDQEVQREDFSGKKNDIALKTL